MFFYLDDVKDDEKSNGKILAVVENSVGKKKVADSNGYNGAIHGKSTRHCSKETFKGSFSIDGHAFVLLYLYMFITFLFKLA